MFDTQKAQEIAFFRRPGSGKDLGSAPLGDLDGSNPDATTISAYSPVTGENYTMSCASWNGGGTVCSGGNGAVVYLP